MSPATGDHLPVKPDTDLYLMAALLREMELAGLWKEDVLREHGMHVDGLRAFIAPYTADAVADVVGLPAAQIREIARIQLRGLEKRLAERGIALSLTDDAYALLGNVGFDPVYGARPLKRAIQAQLENPLAQKILAGEFVSGDTVRVSAEGGKLVFAKA